MEQRTHIPVLALLGLNFTACAGEEEPANPIVGEWNAVQFDGEKLPQLESYEQYTFVHGLRMIVDDELEGDIEYYYVVEYGDIEYHSTHGTQLVVDDAGAPKYRFEVSRDLFDGDDYYDTIGVPDTSDGEYDSGYLGDDDDERPASDALAAASRPTLAPAELVLTCTLEQDTLSCAADEGAPMSVVFKRKKPVEPAAE